MSKKSSINERAVAPLKGMPLWDSGRAADLEWFVFGERRTVKDFHGNPKEVGEYSLHVQCAWRITQEDRVLVGSRDLYYPAGNAGENDGIPEDFNWDVHGANRRDQLIAALVDKRRKQFRVINIEAGDAGALTIALAGNLTLQIFPDDSFPGEKLAIVSPG